MFEPKIEHIFLMIHLLSHGARYEFVKITTTSLGQTIKRSQQAASKYILELEANRFIDRVNYGHSSAVRVTSKGYSEIVKLGSMIQKSISSETNVQIQGRVISGLGEGAYYMSLKGYKKQFKSKIGYVPFPGTLNIKLDDSIHQQAIYQFSNTEGIMINGFAHKNRSFGWVKCFPSLINSINCHVIFLERTHHDESIVEVISDVCLRETAELNDGAEVTLKIPTNHIP